MKDLKQYFDLAREVARELWTDSGAWDKHVEKEGLRRELKERLEGKELESRWDAFEGIDVKLALENVNRKRKQLRIRRLWRVGGSVAAAILVGIVISVWSIRPETPVVPRMAVVQDNYKGAYLVVGDSEQIDLGTTHIFEDQGVTVNNTKEEELSYREKVKIVEKPLIHKLVIPKGCEYKLLLADGTRVWMNAGSELSYPVVFDSVSREVTLKGQAYFEVAKSTVPFIVKTEQMDIRVLGTSFDVMSYEDEPTVQVTLEEGKVQIHAGVRASVLVPGEQAVFARGDSTLSVQQVNTGIYTGWRNGEFIFDNESFASVGRKLSRWYDMEVVIDERLQNESLNGSLKRYESIQEFLNILQLTDKIEVIYHDEQVEILLKEKEKP